jgi:hypothetical protein
MARKNTRSSSLKAPLGSESTRVGKAGRGRTDSSETPLFIRTQGTAIPDELAAAVPRKLGLRLGPFAHQIDSVFVRFQDINGPRGGVDTECRIRVVLASRPDVVASDRAVSARLAFEGACRGVAHAVKRDLARAGFVRGARKGLAAPSANARSSTPKPPPAEGGPIGRRTGPAAARNSKQRAPRATAALEGSAQPRPSRKSKRKSANRTLAAQKLAQKARNSANSPQSRAAAAAARGTR